MSTLNLDLLEHTESLENTGSSGGSSRTQNNNAYWKLILEPNIPEHISFLTDWKRGLKLKLHWNQNAKRMDLCNEVYKKKCELCNPVDKSTKKSFPSVVKLFMIFDFDKVGVKRESKSNPGELYEQDYILIYEQRQGENSENFTILQDSNGDPDQYYDHAGQILPDRLLNCELMFTDNGDDKIWQVKKSVKLNAKGEVDPKTAKTNTSYPPPREISQRKAMENLGKEAKLRVPKEVRDFFNRQTLADLVPHYLTHYGNVDWKAWGISEPMEGSKFSFNKPLTTEAGSTQDDRL